MTKKIKAILIDPVDCSTSYIDIDDNLKSFYSIMDCDLIDAQQIGLDTVMYFDDEGKLKNNQRYFQFTVVNPIAYCGRCIVISSDEDGGNDDVKIDIDVLTKQIEWLPEGYTEEPYMEFIPLN